MKRLQRGIDSLNYHSKGRLLMELKDAAPNKLQFIMGTRI